MCEVFVVHTSGYKPVQEDINPFSNSEWHRNDAIDVRVNPTSSRRSPTDNRELRGRVRQPRCSCRTVVVVELPKRRPV